MSTALRGLTAALGIISVGAAGKAYLSLADEAMNLTAQLKLATAQSGNLGQAQADVKRIADATRNGLAKTTEIEREQSELPSQMRPPYASSSMKKNNT